jgi:hypothetical protein
LSDRLKQHYGKTFGEANVIVFPDSKEVDRSKLDPQKLYLQITHLEPFFTAEEAEKLNYFKRNVLLSKFVFTTPFTLDGRTQGAVEDQYIRKTILSGDTTFPNTLKRIQVTAKREVS